MNLWQQLKESVGQQDFDSEQKSFHQEILAEVQKLALVQGRAEEEVVISLLDQALKAKHLSSQIHRCWESLSQREKEVAALVCSGLTGRQVAARLVLSPETIKTHVRHILRKFDLNSRQDLRNLLADWDFGRWLNPCDTLPFAYAPIFNTSRHQEVFDAIDNKYEV